MVKHTNLVVLKLISLKLKLALTYGLFSCIAVIVLSFTTQFFSEKIFDSYVRSSIQSQNVKIVDSIEEQYNENKEQFDVTSIEALGIAYMHEGFIVSVEDNSGNNIWDARICDMEQCQMILNDIKNVNNPSDIDLVSKSFPLSKRGESIGKVNIESYGPLFYTDNETDFLNSLNKILIALGLLLAICSVVVSIFLAQRIAKPILAVSETAEQISSGNFSVRSSALDRTKEINKLVDSINGVAIALENGEKRQKRLTSDIAHELRTPLTILQCNLEAMIEGVVELTSERLLNCHEEVIRLTNLVEDLKQLSILEQENMILHKKQTDLKDIIFQVAYQLQPLAENKGITFSLEDLESPIIADRNKLIQIFVNLVSNAIKYSDQGKIAITISDLGSNYLVKVADTGIGIHENELSHIFERFYRSDKSRNRETGGAGIGLSIVSSIVAAHGGNISVESQLGKGTVFSVTLPKG
jgi:signal transduction histidine kinase